MVSYLINPDTPIHLNYKPVTKVLVKKKTYLNNIKLNVHTYVIYFPEFGHKNYDPGTLPCHLYVLTNQQDSVISLDKNVSHCTLIIQVHGSYKYIDHTSTLITQVH